jgi:hypothetical protein
MPETICDLVWVRFGFWADDRLTFLYQSVVRLADRTDRTNLTTAWSSQRHQILRLIRRPFAAWCLSMLPARDDD